MTALVSFGTTNKVRVRCEEPKADTADGISTRMKSARDRKCLTRCILSAASCQEYGGQQQDR